MATIEELLEKLEERLILGDITEENYEELKAKLLARAEREDRLTSAEPGAAADSEEDCWYCKTKPADPECPDELSMYGNVRLASFEPTFAGHSYQQKYPVDPLLNAEKMLQCGCQRSNN